MSFLIKKQVQNNKKVVSNIAKTTFKAQPVQKPAVKAVIPPKQKPRIPLPRVLPSTRELQYAEEMRLEVNDGVAWYRVWWNGVLIGYVKGKSTAMKTAEWMWPMYSGKMIVDLVPKGK
jgi:hypothetical protein